MKSRVRVPQLENLETAIRIYYERHELSNGDIKQLFGKCHSSGTVVKLKNLAWERMRERGIPSWNASYVNTDAAFEAWGLDIKQLEANYARLKKLGLGRCAVNEAHPNEVTP